MLDFQKLELPRAKKRSFLAAVIYRTARFLTKVVGHRRVLAVTLDAAWISKRVAFELSVAVFGEEHHNSVTVLTPESLEAILGDARSVIDVGCGYGRMTRLVAATQRDVLGLDNDRAAIDAARKRNDMPNATFRVWDLRNPLDSFGTFDVCILSHVLEHLDRPEDLLSRLRVVSPKLIVEVPDFEADPLNFARIKIGRDFHTDEDHVREFTEWTLRATLTAGGWSVVTADRRGASLLVTATRDAL